MNEDLKAVLALTSPSPPLTQSCSAGVYMSYHDEMLQLVRSLTEVV